MFSVFQYDVYVWSSMPEHLDARTTISMDMFYYILASKLLIQKKIKNKNLPPDHKISEKRTQANNSLMRNFIERMVVQRGGSPCVWY